VAERTCSIDGCDRPARARGWCKAHWQRWSRHGDPLAGRASPASGPLEVRFWARVDRGGPDDCWPWTATMLASGYGWVHAPEVGEERAHRVAWVLTIGPIPEGQVACHRCDNPPCCNPGHLFLGTQAANVADRDEKGRGRGPGRMGPQ